MNTLNYHPDADYREVAMATDPNDTRIREDLKIGGEILREERFTDWTVLPDRLSRGWHWPLKFIRGNTTVWMASKGWIVAERLKDGRMVNHRCVDSWSLEDTLKNEG